MTVPVIDAPAPAYRKRKRSKVPFVIGGIVLVVAIVATAIALSVSGTASAAKEEISIGLVNEPQNLDIRSTAGVALDQILIDNVYQGLVGLKPGTVDQIVPVLAERMPEVSSDGRTYDFALRDGVAFHDGAKLTAQDVVASLTAALTPEVVGGAATVTAPDARSVRVVLAEPNSQLLWLLANRPGLILEAKAKNRLSNSANGTGPFRFEQWKQGDSLTLVRNDDYWGDAANLKTVVFRFIPDGRAAVSALKEGDLDVHAALLPSLRSEFDGNHDFRLERADGTDVFTLAFNSAKPPLNDLRVREALSRAIDTKALIATQHGDGKQIGGPITRLEPGYQDLSAVNAYDPSAARKLLAEAGQQNLSLTLTAPNFYDQSTIDLISTQLADVGVSVKVKRVEFATWLEQVYTNHDYQLSYVDHAEARDFGNYANPGYYFGYDSAKVQQLYAESLRATDPTTANELLSAAEKQVAADAPAKWLYNYTPTNVISTKVTGFPRANTNSRLNLEGVSIHG
ncbi:MULTISPECIES: ABC transporter substrate-binding protein [unclassified Leucobacter]|uniref:ABC transporter substrate-binding protein n=1 Tax=unclassified Leucobacter TaxID=2621730 RepID=UPI00069B782B|nr:ABC transporter substrate-binding protein [Leucobacter sp. Ag1]